MYKLFIKTQFHKPLPNDLCLNTWKIQNKYSVFLKKSTPQQLPIFKVPPDNHIYVWKLFYYVKLMAVQSFL